MKNIFDKIFPFKGATECTYMRVKSNIALLGGMIVFVFLMIELVIGFNFLKKAGIIKMPEEKGAKVKVMRFDEEITIDTYRRFIDNMDKFKKDDDVKAVVIVFNSGGGSPAASDDIAHYILDFKKKKPVYAYVQSICASGAYYIASSATKIYSNPTGIVGSIGVLLPHYNIGKLAGTLGVNEDYVAAGKHKVPISMFRELSKEDKEYLKNNLLSPTYWTFKNFVAENRNLSKEQIDKLAEGIIYTGAMKEVQGTLIDGTTSLIAFKNDLVKEIAEKHNVKEDDVKWDAFDLKQKKKVGLLGVNVDVASKLSLPNTKPLF